MVLKQILQRFILIDVHDVFSGLTLDKATADTLCRIRFRGPNGNTMSKRAFAWMHGLLAVLLMAVAVSAASPAHAQFSKSYEFLKAVRDRDMFKARMALSEGGGTIINARDGDTGETALHIAVNRSDAQWMRFLMDLGANPDSKDGNGNTPLIICANRGFREGLNLLLAYRANVNAVNDAGETALIKAVQSRQPDVVDTLIKRGARVDITDNITGLSAIDYAERDRRSGRILSLLKDAAASKPQAAN
jgi:uncharacterized protein